MHTRAAFEEIQRKLCAAPGTSVVESHYDEKVFGNFWVTYERNSQRSSIVNDRGQLILNNGPADGDFRQILVQDLYAADEDAVLSAVP